MGRRRKRQRPSEGNERFGGMGQIALRTGEAVSYVHFVVSYRERHSPSGCMRLNELSPK